jgi:hypothetical protein
VVLPGARLGIRGQLWSRPRVHSTRVHKTLLEQNRNIVRPITDRWNRDLDGGQSMNELPTEGSSLERFRQILIGDADEANARMCRRIAGAARRSADWPHFSRSGKPQQVQLNTGSYASEAPKGNRASIRLSNESDLAAVRPFKAACFMAKQLRQQHGLGESVARHDGEGMDATSAVMMDVAGETSFAYARFTL